MKVTIIGASTSGLFLAYSLAKVGVETEVYERLKTLGWPPRTLIVTNKLKDILDFDPQEALINEIRYMEIFSKSKYVKLKLENPDLVVERGKLIELLAGRAKKAGAKIILHHRFEGFWHLGKKILVSIRNLETNEEKKVSTDILVGADGLKGRVALSLGGNGYYPVALIQTKVALPRNLAHDTCQVWFSPQHIKYFYWLIPESPSGGVVGLIADHDRQARENLRVFLKEKKLDPGEFQQAWVPLYRGGWFRKRKEAEQNIFLVGDAAAQVKVTTVGGLVPGLYGAKALTYALVNGRNYQNELKKLNRELALHLLVRNILNQFGDKDYDELLSLIKGEVKEILEKWSRDELSISFLKLVLNEPRFISLALRAFLKTTFKK